MLSVATEPDKLVLVDHVGDGGAFSAVEAGAVATFVVVAGVGAIEL